tara:strand:+ start:2116 stop:3168 length:1053 start_codon:yes stop_codon:yes gene_type:complete
MYISDTEKTNLEALAGKIYTFGYGDIEVGKIHNMYHGLNTDATGYSKYDISGLSNIACERYIVENKLLRKEGDARSVEIRFEFSDFYLIVNRQSYVYPNHHVGKTVLILPKNRFINGFKTHSCFETIVNYYHKYLNEEYTNHNVYPVDMSQSNILSFKSQKLFPMVIFSYNGIEYSDYLYPLYYRVTRNNSYKIDSLDFKNDVPNMEFKLGFNLYADIKNIQIEIDYKLGKITNVNLSSNIEIREIHFNHYYYNGKDFELGRYNFHSTLEFESEMLRQIYQYYCSNIDFEVGYLLNKLKYRNKHMDLIRKIIYMKPAVKLFILATMVPRYGLEYPLLNTLVIRKILEEFY